MGQKRRPSWPTGFRKKNLEALNFSNEETEARRPKGTQLMSGP
jgi:hypothetical protein